MNRMLQAVMQRSVVMLVIVLLIVAWGGAAAFHMQRDYMPGINNTTLMVSLRASSYQADQMQAGIADKLDDALKNVDGLANIETTSYDGGLLMNLYFPMDYDMKKAETDTKQALASATLPDDVKAPAVTRLTTSTFPILSYSLTDKSGKLGDEGVRSTVQRDIVNALKTVPGVAAVNTTGAANDGYVVYVRMKDLAKAGLTIDDFNDSVSKELPNWTQGNIANVRAAIPVKIESWDLSDQAFASLLIRNKAGIAVPLSAIADISHSPTDVKTVSRTNGQASVRIDVIKSPSANIIDVAKQVKERAASVPAVKSGDASLALTLDRAHDLNDSLKGLLREGLLGCLFSMLCVLFFFRNVRSTLVIAVSLPVSLLATTAILKSMGITLNILTVSGLIVAMGRIVDDAIVILDNMYRKTQDEKGKPALQTLASAVVEMLPAILASTATTVAVYIPIAFVGGIVGASYSGFAWSVVIAIAVSFFVAALLLPALAFMGGKGIGANPVSLEPMMKPIVLAALKRKKTVIGVTLALLALAAAGGSQLPFSLLPGTATGQVAVKVELPKGSTLPEVDAEALKVEGVLGGDPNVASYDAEFGSAGTPEADDVFDQGGGFIRQPNVANLSLKLHDRRHLEAYIEALRHTLDPVAGSSVITVSNQNIAGDDAQMKITLTGSDQQTLDKAAQTIREKLAAIDGLSVDGKADLTGGAPKYAIALNEARIKKYGVNPDDINRVIARYTAKGKDFKVPSSNGDIPVDVYLDPVATGESKGYERASDVLRTLSAETFLGKDGLPVRLDQLAAVKVDDAPSTIQARDGRPFAVVTTEIVGSPMSKIAKEVNKTLAHTDLPQGVIYSMNGISKQVGQMIEEMIIAVSASILLVLLIVSFVFHGLKAPMAVLVSIPLALTGVVLSLYLIHGQWNLPALVGVLMLTGIVVTNGIVLIDKIERNRRAGMPLREAVVQGSASRIRPILMTAATTVLTLIPLALSSSGDAVVSRTLGIVVIGGMITSTLNSLLVIPILYEWMQGKMANAKIQAQTTAAR
ncbi:efflux RND transporter permease subunit [Cohnella rhizosphaerae]|uniref:Efflux RND transporter permease subunit n=1 Tax=Cohnella rhizosphaerae TaxID=1457232 RepID=A0A9X4KXI9_9BACL|nr:efflux RND transporter permease subunit [Cohnella rhizosphaerae]MDG0812690.1 efflux RND transporter permease subunit [Cohnella rhizosphaerae]